MATHVLAKGTPKITDVYDANYERHRGTTFTNVEVTPIVVVKTEGEDATELKDIGVGVSYQILGESRMQIMGVGEYHMKDKTLMQSWRAMKVLEEMPAIAMHTLCHTFHGLTTDSFSERKRHLDALEKEYGEKEEFAKVLEKVSKSWPSDEEFEGMLNEILMAEISSLWQFSKDIKKHVEEGNLPPLPQVNRLEEEHVHHETNLIVAEANKKLAALSPNAPQINPQAGSSGLPLIHPHPSAS